MTKTYKNGAKALDDVSFDVGSGVFGLLGHNGAGKTTLMKAIVTILRPTKGSVRVCGFDTEKQGEAVRTRIGYLPQELAMYPALTVLDFISYMARLKGITGKEEPERVLEQVEMQDFAGRKIGQLSGGMRRRVGIAQALLGNPRILVVDEPTAGLDPEERVRFRGGIVPLRERRTHGSFVHPHRGGRASALRKSGGAAPGAAVLRRSLEESAGAGGGKGEDPAPGAGGSAGRDPEKGGGFGNHL